MQHDEDGHPGPSHLHRPREDRVLVEKIETRGWLIEQQYSPGTFGGRLPDLRQRAREVRAMQLPSGQGAPILLREIEGLREVHGFADGCVIVRTGRMTTVRG